MSKGIIGLCRLHADDQKKLSLTGLQSTIATAQAVMLHTHQGKSSHFQKLSQVLLEGNHRETIEKSTLNSFRDFY